MSNIAKLVLIVSTTVGLASSALAQTSVADGFEGWCLTENQYSFNPETEETEEYSIGLSLTLDGYEMSFEEGGYCSFSNPVDVPGLDVRVFDTVCGGADSMETADNGPGTFRSMITTIEDPNTLDRQAVLVEPGRVVELSQCLALDWSPRHLELGYESGYRQPNLNTPDVRYLAELIHWRWGTGGTYVDGRLQEAIGLEPNFAGRYIIGTMGGCGTDCSVPFIFDTRDGTEIELTLSDDPNAEYGNFSFSMVNDIGSMIVSWRDDDCVRQEFTVVGNLLELVRETRTPFDPSTWSGYPLHCPAAGEYMEDVAGLASDVLAALEQSEPSELAPVESIRPQAREMTSMPDREGDTGIAAALSYFNPQRNCANNRPVGYDGSLSLGQCIGYLRFMSEVVFESYEPLYYDDGFIEGAHQVDQLCRYDGFNLSIDEKIAFGSMDATGIVMQEDVNTMQVVLNACNTMLRAAMPN